MVRIMTADEPASTTNPSTHAVCRRFHGENRFFFTCARSLPSTNAGVPCFAGLPQKALN